MKSIKILYKDSWYDSCKLMNQKVEKGFIQILIYKLILTLQNINTTTILLITISIISMRKGKIQLDEWEEKS